MMADRSKWIAEAERQLALSPDAPVRIDVHDFTYDTTRGSMSMQVVVTTMNGLPVDSSVAYRVTAIVKEESIDLPQARYVPDGIEQIDHYLHDDVVGVVWPDETGRELIPPEEAIHGNWIGPGVRLDQEINLAIPWRRERVKHMTLVLLVHVMRHGELGEILGAWQRPIVMTPSGVEWGDHMPGEAMTMEVGPNPASGALGLAYRLPRRGHVTIELFSVGGALLRALDVGMMDAGDHVAEIDVARLPPGACLIRLSVNGSSTSRLVTVAR